MPGSKPIVILGGGITGLATAYYLEKAGFTNITLVEAGNRLGGKIQTIQEDGFLVERGPDSFITTKPYALDLIDELGLGPELIAPKTGKFFILKDGTLQSSPEGLRMMVPTRLKPFLDSSLFTWDAKHRILAESRVPANDEPGDESFGAFIRRRFGTEMLENYAEPLFCGIYATSSDELSMDATFPQFRDLERRYGCMSHAVKKMMQQPSDSAEARSPFLSLRRGIQQLPDALSQVLKFTRIVLNTAALRVEKDQKQVLYYVELSNGETIKAEELVVTLPAPVAKKLLKPVSVSLAAVLDEFTNASSHIVTLAYERRHIQRNVSATGFVSALNERFGMSAGTWASEKWEGRAPADHVLVRCFMGNVPPGAIHDEDQLLDIAVKENQNLLLTTSGPVRHWIHHWDTSLPQYKVGHKEKVSRLKKAASDLPKVHLSGAYLEGVGIPDCIRQAQLAAAEVVANTVQI